MTIAARVRRSAPAPARRWEYRQRNLAHGAWDRFRAALAHASEAYVIDDATASALIVEGYASDGRGREPPRALVWITAHRAVLLHGARPIELRLDAALLAARCLALVPFAIESAHRESRDVPVAHRLVREGPNLDSVFRSRQVGA